MGRANNVELASEAFESLQKLFPDLTMTIDRNPRHVDLGMDILKQPGLDFDIYLNLQNEDELHISTHDIWCEWFPISDNVVTDYIDAVKGLITGEYRILKFARAGTVYKAFLQKQTGDRWVTVFRDLKKFRFPWTRLETQIIRNTNDKHLVNN